jgi:molybdopterin-biosynthesis enzyme MoeA-like protein
MTAPTAAILIIGNEILSGRTQDINVQFIARQLVPLGIRLEEVRVVPDIAPRIIDAVNTLRAAYTVVFTTGGIGPTHDDITSECIAAAFGVPWEPHEPSMTLLRQYLGARMNPEQARMATFPRGAEPIRNNVSIAPGFTIGNVHVMAGVPRIMQSMFLALEPSLPRGAPILSRALHGMGIMEGNIAAGLTEIQARFPDVDLGSYPYKREEGWGVAIVAKGTEAARLEVAMTEVQGLIESQGIFPTEGEPD